MLPLIRGKRLPLSSHQLRFLQLPPNCRSFSQSPKSQFLEVPLLAVHGLFEGLHSATGLSWAYTIPLSALIIRTTIALPLNIISRRNDKKRIELMPLLAAWQRPLQNQTMAEVGHLGPVKAQSELKKKMEAKRKEIYKRHDVVLWKPWLPVLQMPVFVACLDILRRMTGAGGGLLSFITSASQDVNAPALIPVEPSFAVEGMLWFPNLLVSDPQLLLPFMLSAAMFFHIGLPSGKKVSLMQKRLKTTLLGVALAIGPLMLQMPSGMVLYWFSSTCIAWIQAAILERVIPIKPPPTPCKPKQRE